MEGATKIAAALEKNNTITNINLNCKFLLLFWQIIAVKTLCIDTQIGIEGVTAIAAALKNNYVVLECEVEWSNRHKIEALCQRNQVNLVNVWVCLSINLML